MAEPVTSAASTPTPFNIAELNEGVQRGMEVIGAFYSGPYTALYGVAILAGFAMLVKDNMKGGALLSEIGKWFAGVVVIILLFVVPSEKGTPYGFWGATAVINDIVGGLNAQAGKIPKLKMPASGIDISSKPMMFEKYALKVHKAREAFMVKHTALAPDIKKYVAQCQDPNKIRQSPPQYNYLEFHPSYMRDNAKNDSQGGCSQLGSQLYDAVRKASEDVARDNEIDTTEAQGFISHGDHQGRVLSDAEAAEVGENRALNAVQKGLLAILLKVLSIAAVVAALVYANVIPYFIGLTASLLVMCFPIVVAMAMLPGQWGKIVTYFEGYLWLMFIPVIVTAVDGVMFSKLAKAGLFDLDATLLVLGKIAIVMSAPAIAGFVLFGQKGNFQGMSGVSGMVGGAAAAAIMAAAHAGVGAAKKAVAGGAAGKKAAEQTSSPGGDSPLALPHTDAIGGGSPASAGMVHRNAGSYVHATNDAGNNAFSSPADAQRLGADNANAIAAMQGYAGGESSLMPGTRVVSSEGGSAMTCNVSSGGITGAAAPECSAVMNAGGSVGVMAKDSVGGGMAGVTMSKAPSGGFSFEPMNAKSSADIRMAQALRDGKNMDGVYMQSGTAMTAGWNKGEVSFAPIRNGIEMPNASVQSAQKAQDTLSRMRG